jgi:16S rRNA (uracil1498-N3)-methyltransferase
LRAFFYFRPMQLFYCPEVLDESYYLNSEESKHCIKVLRKSEGDHIHLIDGSGGFYEVKITIASQKKVLFEVVNEWKEGSREYYLHIAIAPTKNNDRLEWFLEKVTEIGIDEITPIICQHSERKFIKEERLNKIILSATKQSLKSKTPILNSAISLKEFLSKTHSSDCFIAHCEEGNKQNLQSVVSNNSTILIGPEGDFSTTEIEVALACNFTPIGLGNSRLRTETAGIVACHTIALHHEKI